MFYWRFFIILFHLFFQLIHDLFSFSGPCRGFCSINFRLSFVSRCSEQSVDFGYFDRDFIWEFCLNDLLSRNMLVNGWVVDICNSWGTLTSLKDLLLNWDGCLEFQIWSSLLLHGGAPDVRYQRRSFAADGLGYGTFSGDGAILVRHYQLII